MTAAIVARMDTERLIMRRWREEDREPFAAMNADPEVVLEHFPALLTRDESDAFADRIEQGFDRDGHGLGPRLRHRGRRTTGSPATSSTA